MANPTISRLARSRRARRERLYWCLSGVAVIGVAFAVFSTVHRDPSVRVLRTATTKPVATSSVPPAHLTSAPSLPRTLIVPSLGINIAIGQLGLQANHEVQVPSNAHSVGWYRLGPPPGQLGSAVILGHVDSYKGPGIFFNIKSLPLGALIEVGRSDHTTALFRVTSVVQYAKSSFPDALVYGASGGHFLNLVTCGGTFDHQTGSYESNIVVFSRLVGVQPA